MAVGFLPALWSQPAPNTALPLPESYFPELQSILESSLKQSPRMILRNAEEAIAEQSRIAARAGQLPSAGGGFSYYPWDRQYRLVSGTVATGNRLGYNFSINQPVFAWGALKNNTRIYELQQKIAQGQTAETYRLLASEIRTAYLNLVLRKAALERAQLNQQIADAQLDIARTKREKNVISEADMFGPTITAEQARLSADRAADDYDGYRRYFAKLTGRPAPADDAIPDAIPAVTVTSDEVSSVVTEFNRQPDFDTYVLRNMRRQIDIEKLNYKIAATRLKPKVNAVVAVTQDQQRIVYGQEVPYEIREVYAGISVNWSIWDSFSTRASKKISLSRRRELEQSYREATEDLVQSVRDKKKQIEFSARNLAIVEKQLEAASNTYVATKEDLKRGLTSEAGVDSAQLYFYDARINAYGARYDYMLKVADLLSTIMKDPALANLPSQYR